MRSQLGMWLIEGHQKAIAPSPGTALRHDRHESIAPFDFVPRPANQHRQPVRIILGVTFRATPKHSRSSLTNDSIPMARRLSPTRLFPKS